MIQKTQRSSIDWATHIKAQQDSNLSGKAYCASRELNYDQFGYYKRKQSKTNQRIHKKSEPCGFATVSVESISPRSSSALSLLLPSGIRIEGIDDGNLSVCLSLLGRLS